MMENKHRFETDIWEPVPMISKELRDKGLAGGEGCQWPLCITRDQQDGQLAFLAIDVAKPYKSLDGGKTWRPIGKGLHCLGNNFIAIDPTNKNHVVTVGADEKGFYLNGLYLSWDCGESWHGVKQALVNGHRDYRRQVCFDPTTFDEKIGGSAVMYWSREKDTVKGHNHPALYQSVDGGESWVELPDSEKFGGCHIAVNQNNGWLYIAGENGFWRSKDKAKSFEKLHDYRILWLETVFTHPDSVYLTTTDGMYVSHDGADSFTLVESNTFPSTNPRFLSVNPANPDDMIVQDDLLFSPLQEPKEPVYFTHDGGKTWEKSQEDVSDSVIPFNPRPRAAAWAPDGRDVLSLGGDFVLRSEDKGENWALSNTGFNGLCIGGEIGFNVNNPDNIFVPLQDYNGAYSTDGGYTWKYVNWNEQCEGGHTYGGYCWNDNELCAGVAKNRDGEPVGGEVEICVTRDGGKTIQHTGCICTGVKKCMAIPGDDDTLFFGEWKTTDRGRTWKRLADDNGQLIIEGVVGYDYSSERIFAIKIGVIYESYDKGETWNRITQVVPRPEQFSYDHKRDIIYCAMDQFLFKIGPDRAMFDVDCGIFPVHGVAVHPDNPDIIYVSGFSGLDHGINNIARSVDGGKTWVTLSGIDCDNGFVTAGRANNLYIKRDTNQVYVHIRSRGLWKMKVPDVK